MEIKAINRDELMKLLASGQKVNLVDVREKEHYDEEHMAGAILMPLHEVREKASVMLPNKDEIIVTYCVDIDCPKSAKAAKILTSLGYKNVFHYPGGIKEYTDANLPVEKANDK